MTDLPAFVIRHRRWVACGFLAIGLALLPFAPQTADKLEVGGAGIERSEAAQVDSLLASQFVAPFSKSLVLVVTGVPSPKDAAGRLVLSGIVDQLGSIGSVTGVMSYLDRGDPIFVGTGGTFVVAGLASGSRRMDGVVLELRSASDLILKRLRAMYPMAELSWTGGAAFDYDVRLTSATDAKGAEQRVLPVTLALLFVVFGSLIAALCPAVTGGLAVGLSLGVAVLISPYWPLTVLLQNIVSMLGLGIGIDYSLLMVSRFREELRNFAAPEAAAAETLRTAGRTVLLSGGAVAIGFSALLVIPATELRSIATGGLLVVGFSVLLATTLLPGLLAWLGPRVETGRLWRPRPESGAQAQWRWWGRCVVMHPWSILVVACCPLVVFAWQARHISTDIPSGNWLPSRMESSRGVVALQRMGQSGVVQTIRVLVQLPAGQGADTQQGWSAIARLSHSLEGDPRVVRVLSLPLLLKLATGVEADTIGIPADVRAAYVSRDARMASIELIPHESASAGALMRLVRELRRMDVAERTGLEGSRIIVGGLPAQNADYQDAIGGSTLYVILFIVIGTFVALLLGLRSLLGALKAVALNLLSVAAAMGITVLVFQDGYGAGLLGVANPLDGLFPAVPIIVFCIVFGLSIDYEVFLLSRVAEEVRKGQSNESALVEGLARTGGVITSAALVMVVVFAGFSLGDFLIVKILGFSLAVAVLIDATLVRLAVGPALLQIGGRWNWWPGTRALHRGKRSP